MELHHYGAALTLLALGSALALQALARTQSSLPVILFDFSYKTNCMLYIETEWVWYIL